MNQPKFNPCFEIPGATSTSSSANCPSTIVIYGVPRGGTTMVAGVSRLLGLHIGNDLPVNCEDPAFNLDLLSKSGRPILESLKKALSDRYQSYEGTQGWKYPRAAAYLDEIRDLIVSPKLILVTRDPSATAARSVSRGRAVIEAIDSVQKTQCNNLELLERWGVPSLIVSYERAIQQPQAFIESLGKFIETPQPKDIEKIISYIHPGRYESINS